LFRPLKSLQRFQKVVGIGKEDWIERDVERSFLKGLWSEQEREECTASCGVQLAA